MSRWKVSCVDGAVEVPGSSWLAAVGEAVAALGLTPDVLNQMVCDVDSGRSVVIRNPKTHYVFLVERLDDAADPSVADAGAAAWAVTEPARDYTEDVERQEWPEDEDLGEFEDAPSVFELPLVDQTEAERVAAQRRAEKAEAEARMREVLARRPPPVPDPGAVLELDTVAPQEVDPIGVVAPGAEGYGGGWSNSQGDWEPSSEMSLPPIGRPPPSFEMPVPLVQVAAQPVTQEEFELISRSPAQRERAPDDLEETLFMAAADIGAAGSMEEAANATLNALLALVPVDACAVLYAGAGDMALRFLVARGPEADEAMTQRVPLDEGIAGFVHRRGASLIIQDAASDERILRDVEVSTGYKLRSMLAAVVRDSAGTIHGCIELINPPRRFLTWHLHAAEELGTALGNWIGARAQG